MEITCVYLTECQGQFCGFAVEATAAVSGASDLYTAHRIPAFHFSDDGELMSHYIPYFSEDYIKRDALPADHEEVRAQKAIKDVLWNRPELYLETLMEPGDMQFVSNRIALHSRTDYKDWPEIERAAVAARLDAAAGHALRAAAYAVFRASRPRRRRHRETRSGARLTSGGARAKAGQMRRRLSFRAKSASNSAKGMIEAPPPAILRFFCSLRSCEKDQAAAFTVTTSDTRADATRQDKPIR